MVSFKRKKKEKHEREWKRFNQLFTCEKMIFPVKGFLEGGSVKVLCTTVVHRLCLLLS